MANRRKPEDEKAVSIGYSLPRWMHRRITEVADSQGIPAAEVMRDIITAGFEKRRIPLRPTTPARKAAS
jgi:hypothetical protein